MRICCALGMTKSKAGPRFAFKARVVQGRAQIVQVAISAAGRQSVVKVIATLPGRLPKNGNRRPLGLGSDRLGRNLERAFQLAVKQATQP